MDIGHPPSLTVLQFEGVVIAALSVLFAFIWHQGREAGTRMLAVGFAVGAMWYLNADRIPYAGPNIDTAQQRLWSAVILSGVMIVSVGVVQYLGAPRGWRRVPFAAFWAPGALLLIGIALTPEIPRRIFHFGTMLPYLGAALLALRRGRQHPGDGHVLLGLALLATALSPYLLLAIGLPAAQLKYYAGATVVLFGMSLLTISLLRRQRALNTEVQLRAEAEAGLREANSWLETRVEERTAHLRELIGGLESFNRSVSHDLRGPLGGMSTLARLAAVALACGDATVAERALPVIARQCDASVDLVATMLELARLGDVKLKREQVCLTELVQAAFDEVMLGLPADERPELHCAPMPALQVDPRLLRPVLVNLIGNAVKFSRHAARPRVVIDAAVHGREITICVRDNGVGLTPEIAERIFAPFYRAHAERFEGHGLGLSIVRRAVQILGGRAWAESRPEGGAALCFTVPDAVADEATPQTSAAVAA